MSNKNITGFGELQKELRRLQDNLKNLDGTHSVPFDELFHDSFMQEFTDYVSIDALFEASGFKVDSEADFEKIPDKEWDEFVQKSTQFKNWEEMLNTAGEEFVSKKLGF